MLKADLKVVENAVILSNIIFSSAKIHMHIFKSYNNFARFQIDCLKSLGGVDYTNFWTAGQGQKQL